MELQPICERFKKVPPGPYTRAPTPTEGRSLHVSCPQFRCCGTSSSERERWCGPLVWLVRSFMCVSPLCLGSDHTNMRSDGCDGECRNCVIRSTASMLRAIYPSSLARGGDSGQCIPPPRFGSFCVIGVFEFVRGAALGSLRFVLFLASYIVELRAELRGCGKSIEVSTRGIRTSSGACCPLQIWKWNATFVESDISRVCPRFGCCGPPPPLGCRHPGDLSDGLHIHTTRSRGLTPGGRGGGSTERRDGFTRG